MNRFMRTALIGGVVLALLAPGTITAAAESNETSKIKVVLQDDAYSENTDEALDHETLQFSDEKLAALAYRRAEELVLLNGKKDVKSDVLRENDTEFVTGKAEELNAKAKEWHEGNVPFGFGCYRLDNNTYYVLVSGKSDDSIDINDRSVVIDQTVLDHEPDSVKKIVKEEKNTSETAENAEGKDSSETVDDSKENAPSSTPVSSEEKNTSEAKAPVKEKTSSSTAASVIKKNLFAAKAPAQKAESASEKESAAKSIPLLSYSAHIQNIGWQSAKTSPEAAGQDGLQIEAFKVILPDEDVNLGSVQVSVHQENIGWEKPVETDKDTFAGVTGQSLRLEAIKINLTGKLAESYDIYYRTQVESEGWLAWAKNGEPSGTQGRSLKITGIQVELRNKNDAPASETQKRAFYGEYDFTYSAHVENYGWMDKVSDGNIAGIAGSGLRMEALQLTLSSELRKSGNVQTSAHVQNYGWLNPAGSGEVAGTTGQGLRLEALNIKLTGELADQYDIYYRTNVEGYGWLGWAKNGQNAGTKGLALKIEAVEIDLRHKNDVPSYASSQVSAFHSNEEMTYSAHVQNYGWMSDTAEGSIAGTTGQRLRLEALKVHLSPELRALGDVQICPHVQNYGWMSWNGTNEIAGTTGQGLRLEAIKIRLTGKLAEQYDIYYRSHVENFGWLDWTANGQPSGTEQYGYRMEAIQIILEPKGSSAAPATGGSAYHKFVSYHYNVPYYNQCDPRWSWRNYGAGTLGGTGCSPTAIAMALSAVKRTEILPPETAAFLYAIGKYNNPNTCMGTCGSAKTAAAMHWGVNCDHISSLWELEDALRRGKVIIESVGRGNFVYDGTHAIVLQGLDKYGYTYVKDPWTSTRNGRYSVASLWNQQSTDIYDCDLGAPFFAYYTN